MILATLALAAATSTAPPAVANIRLALGTEWDSNARRGITGDPARPVVSDAVARLVAELSAYTRPHDDHAFAATYVLGTKRFFEEAAEDLLVHNLSGLSQHTLAESWSATTFGSLRASRMRNNMSSGTRDYSVVYGGGSLELRPTSELTLSANGSWTSFTFVPMQTLSFVGPTAGLDASYRLTDEIFAGARGQVTWRNFEDSRYDTEPSAGVRLGYRGKWRATLEYLARFQRSTNKSENIDRHRITLFAITPLFLEINGTLSAALQINDGTSLTDNLQIADDDENQNSIQVGLSRKIGGELALEVRYALFANQFSTAPTNFLRQTMYLGVSYRLGD
jgi:hypothetical protein